MTKQQIIKEIQDLKNEITIPEIYEAVKNPATALLFARIFLLIQALAELIPDKE